MDTPDIPPKHTSPQSNIPRPVSMPLYLSTTYARNPDGSYPQDFVYAREDNPNRRHLEAQLAGLEKGAVGLTYASGMAAVHAVFQSLNPGDHILLPDDVYYQVYALAARIFGKWGLECSRVDMSNLSEVEQAIQKNTSLIWVESPSNPQLKITDIKAVAELAHIHHAVCAVDNTWPTPILQNPLALGADLVMHSTSKYIGGHSDVLSGCLVVKEAGEWAERLKEIQVLAGGVPSPFDCWLLSRGIETLEVRVQAQTQRAATLANYLSQHPRIEQVIYPGLARHPQHTIATQQMKKGYGAMLAVLIKGNEQTARRIAHQLQHFHTATSLGGVESLIEHRKSVEGPTSPTPDNLLRISVGLEPIEVLMADWEQALEY